MNIGPPKVFRVSGFCNNGLEIREREMRLLAKVGVNYHRPLSKFDQIVIESTKNLARTWQETKTTYLISLISG